MVRLSQVELTEEEKMAAFGWQVWALLSAVFAALTAILAKVGVERSIRTSPRLFARS